MYAPDEEDIPLLLAIVSVAILARAQAEEERHLAEIEEINEEEERDSRLDALPRPFGLQQSPNGLTVLTPKKTYLVKRKIDMDVEELPKRQKSNGDGLEVLTPPLATSSSKEQRSSEEDSIIDVPDLVPVQQPTTVDESTVKIEIQEEPLNIDFQGFNDLPKLENDLPTVPENGLPTVPSADIHEEPIIIKEERSDEQDDETLETMEQLDDSERESIQMFFDSMAKTVMTLSPSFVRRIKLEVLRVVTDMEMEAYEEKMAQVQEPIRKPDNVTAASLQTEPKIKIEIEDEESEAVNEPNEPESLDSDDDANYEPLAKKKKKSKAEQPTSAFSTLRVEAEQPTSASSSFWFHRPPRTQHEPVEKFFQSIAYTVTSFPPPFVCRAKVAVLKVVSKMQVEASRSGQSGCQDGGGGADDSTKRHLVAGGSDY